MASITDFEFLPFIANTHDELVAAAEHAGLVIELIKSDDRRDHTVLLDAQGSVVAFVVKRADGSLEVFDGDS